MPADAEIDVRFLSRKLSSGLYVEPGEEMPFAASVEPWSYTSSMPLMPGLALKLAEPSTTTTYSLHGSSNGGQHSSDESSPVSIP